jgi:hypothetical protein
MLSYGVDGNVIVMKDSKDGRRPFEGTPLFSKENIDFFRYTVLESRFDFETSRIRNTSTNYSTVRFN